VVFFKMPVAKPDSRVPLSLFALIVPVPVKSREAPVPITIAAVVFVLEVSPENADDPLLVNVQVVPVQATPPPVKVNELADVPLIATPHLRHPLLRSARKAHTKRPP
jgi:hypothetical protein